MKAPLAVIEMLLFQGTQDERSAAREKVTAVLRSVGEQEQTKRRQAGEPPLNRWNVLADDGRCVAPQIYAWANGDDQLLRHRPSEDVCNLLNHSSQMTLQIPLLQESGQRPQRNVAIGTRSAIVASELMKEAKLVGVINEKDQLHFKMTEILEPLAALGIEKVLILDARQVDAEYLGAKRELANSDSGRQVLRLLGISANSDRWRRLFKLPSFS